MSRNKEYEILRLLKNNLIKVKHLSDDHFKPESMLEKHPDSSDFYLKDRLDNLFESPYKGIDYRCNAIKSSAAMIFNTLGYDTYIIDGVNYKEAEFEYPLPAIKSDDDSKHEAKIDVYLESEDGKSLFFIESKLLEWMSSPKNLSEAYLNTKQYLNSSNAEFFTKYFSSLLKEPRKKDNKSRFIGKYRKYDAIQMTIHILAIHNFCIANKGKIENIKLANVVWDYPSSKQYQNEKKQAEEYCSKANKVFKELFDKIGINFMIEYIPYSDFLNKLSNLNNERKKYLARYKNQKL